MLQKNTENGSKSTQNPVKMGSGTPWGSIVKLRSELYGFWVLFGVPLWPYFLTFLAAIFQHFPQPLFNTVLEEWWCYFGSVLEAFLAHFGEPLKKWKCDSRCSGSTVFKVPGDPKITLFWFNYESTFWGGVFGTLFTDFGSVWGVLWEFFWDLISILIFEHFSLSFWPPLQP